MALSPFLYNLPTPNGQGRNKFNFPTPVRTPFDIVQLGTYTLPGISTVEITRQQKLIEQKKKQGKGNNAINSGVDLADVKITTRIFFQDEYTQMEKVLDELEDYFGFRDPKAKSSPSFLIQHPDTRMRGISSVCITSIDGPKHHMPPGYTEFIINCKEVVRPRDQTPKVQKPPKQGPIQTSTPLDPSFAKVLPSQDPAITQPNRTKPK